MSNPSKEKGTKAETAVINWARKQGYPHADRQPLRGNRDAGDIALCPGVILEVKNHRLPTGHPTAAVLAEWMMQTWREQINAHADLGILVVKRAGTTDPGQWHAYLTAWDFALIAAHSFIPVDVGPVLPPVWAPVCLPLGALTRLMRIAGWGAPLDEGSAA